MKLHAFIIAIFSPSSALGESVPGEREALPGQGKDDDRAADAGPALSAAACLSRKVPGMRLAGEIATKHNFDKVLC